MNSGENNDDELQDLGVLERLYAVIHHADDTQQNDDQNNHFNTGSAPTITTKSALRRYWHTGDDQAHVNTNFQKVNTQKPSNIKKQIPPTKTTILPTPSGKDNNIAPITKLKEEAAVSPKHQVTYDLESFGSPLTKGTKTVVKIENDEIPSIDLGTSDEDEVIEIALPPKPTITIESSDEDEICVITKQVSEIPEQAPEGDERKKKPTENSRDDSTSPVPSVVSSVSDEFIRGDCIALNISSRRPDNPSFDFSLHGSDLLEAPSKKKRKKKSKKNNNVVTPTTSATFPDKTNEEIAQELFATPKSKVKNKKHKAKANDLTEKSIPSPDIYDSDSNQSFDNSKRQTYAVTEQSLPSADVYESDSSQPEIVRALDKSTLPQPESVQVLGTVSTAFVIKDLAHQEPPAQPTLTPSDTTPGNIGQKDYGNSTLDTSVVDLTDDLDQTAVQEDTIDENIFMANVTGFEESTDYGDYNKTPKDPSKLGSTKVPAILYSDLDFDLNQNEKRKTQCYSLSKLRAEMEKFYNESWGGENFNHREIQKTMSRDKSLWEIDPKDRMPSPYRRKITCHYCNRVGHRDDTCRMKPPVCHVCGDTGHREPRCPHKICVNCGSPNQMYSTICRNCSNWCRVTCAECHQLGHPYSHCPDLWRRYHNTLDNNTPLEQYFGQKKHWQQYCSGCTRRGHLVHTCRLSLPFSGLPINSPYVVRYQPFYPPSQPRGKPFTDENDKALQNNSVPRGHKRHSKSPAPRETHANKKRRESAGDCVENRKAVDKQTRSPQLNRPSTPQRMRTQSENSPQKSTVSSQGDFQNTRKSVTSVHDTTMEKALDYIPVSSINHDKKGQVIQDNEVSDSSDAVTSARIYVTDEALSKLKMEKDWLKEKSMKYKVKVEEGNLVLNATGRLADIESFQAELRDWLSTSKVQPEAESTVVEDPTHLFDNIPKNRYHVLKKLSKAFQSLEKHLGNPKALLKELKYRQHNHSMLQKKKHVSSEKLRNNRDRINEVVTKLNMILLGQAGLAGGSKHTHELRSLVQKLTNVTSKKITLGMRKKIGEHYHSIFTAVIRTDYPQLLAEYSNKGYSRKTTITTNREPATVRPFTGIAGPCSQDVVNVRANKNVLGRLLFYHRRLTNSGSKECLWLARRFHGLIASFKKNDSLSTKASKKWRKLREQADLLLKQV